MPSPFPGMDPYLEDRTLWPDLHQRLIAYTAEALQEQIRPKYVARIGERVELSGGGRSVIPDGMVVQPSSQPVATETTPGLLIADEPMIVAGLDEARRVPYVEVIDGATREVVTLIKVLSPANKIGAGRAQYLEKQEALLATAVNLLEVDLLGYGQPTVLAHNVAIATPPDWRYLVNISRGTDRRQLEIYAIPLEAHLPRCRVPLRAPDSDAVLDLPAVFTRCYDEAAMIC